MEAFPASLDRDPQRERQVQRELGHGELVGVNGIERLVAHEPRHRLAHGRDVAALDQERASGGQAADQVG